MGRYLPLNAALDDIPALPVTPGQAQLLLHGQRLAGFPAPPGLCMATLEELRSRSSKHRLTASGSSGVSTFRRSIKMSITAERKDALIKEHGRGKADTGSTEVQVRDFDRAHQQSDLAFQDAREGQPFAPRLADDGQPGAVRCSITCAAGTRSATPT